MSTIITRGAASAQALGYAASASAANYIEDVFSTYLYAGNSGTQTITNGVDLSTKGGLVWIKNRDNGQAGHALTDTARGAGTGTAKASTNILQTNSAAGTGGGLPSTSNDYLSAFTTSGFTVVSGGGANDGTKVTNRSGGNYVSWSFRKQAKFFDVVTYTGDGVAGRTVSHSLGSVPGCIIVKRSDSTAADWQVYHRSIGATKYILLNSTAAESTVGASARWNSTAPTSTNFTLGDGVMVNNNGTTYVAYLFAHDAGGFGASGTDNVVSCGSFTTNGSGIGTITLGYEPQWVLIKRSDNIQDWYTADTMRGWVNTSGQTAYLIPNTANAEASGASWYPTATGAYFDTGSASATYIYIAIRRGPMRTPTSGTSVFTPVTYTGDGNADRQIGTTITPDLSIVKARTNNTVPMWADRLRGTASIYSSATAAETNPTTGFSGGGQIIDTTSQTGIKILQGTSNVNNVNQSTITYVDWNFRRAPGFFDTVCYTGTGALQNVSHNLGAVPQLLIVKRRDTVEDWNVYSATTGNAAYLRLNTDAAVGTAGADALWGSTTPTSSVFTVKTSGGTNASGGTYVAYLFASVSGVSKVGTYTGNGTTNQIDCGFTGGARFVMIKRTSSTGNWYIWDTARGIIAANDPYLLLNSTATEVTSTDYVDSYSAGFEISSTAPAEINSNGGTFIFLAIA